jgi:hypothetical protein
MTTLAQPQALGQRDNAALIGALIAAGIGALFGFGGFLAVVLGDDMIALDTTSIAAVGLAALGLIAAVFVRDLPGYAAAGMAAGPIGYLVAFGGNWSTWWARYQDAVATSGAAENVFWSNMPAMALFAISGAFLVTGALLAAFNAFSDNDAEVKFV